MLRLLQSWLLARKLRKLTDVQLEIKPEHISQIVREKHSRYKLGSCTVTNFMDDKLSRDASIVSVNITGDINFQKQQRENIDKAKTSILESKGVEMPDDFIPPPTKVEVRNIVVVDGEIHEVSPSFINKNVHNRLKKYEKDK